jgi:chromosome segregation ATPase
MRSRDKFLILLFAATLALGALILSDSGDNRDALLRFRLLFSNPTAYNLGNFLTSIADGASLWYGGISLFAIIMIGFILKTARADDLQALRERLTELEAGKAEAEKLLHDGVLKERHARHAKDAALQDLEGSARRIYALENDLLEQRELLESRDEELKTLRSQISTLPDGPSEPATETESVLRDELKKKADLLQAKDCVITELEESLRGKQELLHGRGAELEKLKSKVNTLTEQLTDLGLAKERTENALQQELKKKTDLLQAKDSFTTELENSLRGKQELLHGRGTELEKLKSKVNTLTEQLTDLGLAKERTENAFQQELKKKADLLHAKDSVITELEESLRGKQELLHGRSTELEKLKSKVNTLTEQLTDLGLAKERTENMLQRDLKKKTKVLQSRDSAITELETNFRGKIQALRSQLSEKQELLQGRNREVRTLKSKVNALTGQLADLGLAKERSENALQRELQKKTELLQARAAAGAAPEESSSTRIHALEGQLAEKEELLRVRDAELEDLQSKVSRFAELGSVREQAKSVLEQELKNRTELLQAKEVTVRELQHRLSTTVANLESAQGEVERLLREREAGTVPSEEPTKTRASKEPAHGLLPPRRRGLNSRLHELNAAKTHGGLQLEGARRLSQANEPAVDEPEQILRVEDQEILLTEEDALLESDDRRMEQFEAELIKKDER